VRSRDKSKFGNAGSSILLLFGNQNRKMNSLPLLLLNSLQKPKNYIKHQFPLPRLLFLRI
jgi:hypothetical protein